MVDPDRLRRALHDAGDAADVPVVDWMPRVAAVRARRQRARRAALAGVLTLSAVGAGVVIARTGDGGREMRSISPATRAPEPTTVGSSLPTGTSTSVPATATSPAWRPLPAPPIPIRSGIVTAWTGTEYLVVGLGPDSPESAAYDPATATWRTISGAPLAGRTDAVALWTGSRLLVWGGAPADGDGAAPLDDGAMYDPAADEWSPMAPLPGGGRRASNSAAVWSGSELLVWGGGTAPDDGAAYDPVTDTWRPLPPAPIAWRDAPAGVWTGGELILWGGSRALDGVVTNLADGATYRPATDSWEVLPAAPMEAAVVDAAWTGTAVVFTPGFSGDPTGTPFAHDTGGVYDPASRTWAPARWLGQHPGTQLLAVNGQLLATAKGGSLLLDPADGSAVDVLGDDVPGGIDGRTAAWTGAQVVALALDGHGLVGFSPPGTAAAVECTDGRASPVDASHPSWTLTPLALASRTGAATAWTGNEYVVWGGTDGASVFADGAVVDPASGTARPIAAAPIDGRTGALAIWTGDEVLIVGGAAGPVLAEPLTSQPTAAYDPATDRWRLIPRSEVQLDLVSGDSTRVAWSGTDLYVFQGAAGAVFEPAAGTWLALPDLPDRGPVVGAAWTGSELLTVTTGAVFAYEPPAQRPTNDDVMDSAGGAWRQVTPAPTRFDATSAVWTGAELLVAGGPGAGDDAWTFAALDPVTQGWRLIGDATWAAPDLVWTGSEVIFSALGGFGVVETESLESTVRPIAVQLQSDSGSGTGDGAVFLAQRASGACPGGLLVARYRS